MVATSEDEARDFFGIIFAIKKIECVNWIDLGYELIIVCDQDNYPTMLQGETFHRDMFNMKQNL